MKLYNLIKIKLVSHLYQPSIISTLTYIEYFFHHDLNQMLYKVNLIQLYQPLRLKTKSTFTSHFLKQTIHFD